jgi:hypothetical protein
MIPSTLAKDLRVAIYTHLTQQCVGLSFVYENQVTRPEDRSEYAEVKMAGPRLITQYAEDVSGELMVQVDVYWRPTASSPSNMYRVTELAGQVLTALTQQIRLLPYGICLEVLSARMIPRDKVVSPAPLFCTSVLVTYRFEHNFTETSTE